ncbi:uncharacterized protein LOC132545541 [Ylistrum balloti]|uniref:uncharacterized protein LOC132545541 n=1 Tax=Ylistrum balloti TaxID=509963 RepID=UPI002905E54A|nr:uncharacterized protein LOC132545541 [Ylistrum balloti]
MLRHKRGIRSFMVLRRHYVRIVSVSVLTVVILFLFLHIRDNINGAADKSYVITKKSPVHDWQEEKILRSYKETKDYFFSRKNKSEGNTETQIRFTLQQNGFSEAQGYIRNTTRNESETREIDHHFDQQEDIAQQGHDKTDKIANNMGHQIVQQGDITRKQGGPENEIIQQKDQVQQGPDAHRFVRQNDIIVKDIDTGHQLLQQGGVAQKKDDTGHQILQQGGVAQKEDDTGHQLLQQGGVAQKEDDTGHQLLQQEGVAQKKDDTGHQLLQQGGVAQKEDDTGRQILQQEGVARKEDDTGRQLLQQGGVARKEDDTGRQLLQQDHDIHQLRHINEMKINEKPFTPDEYPLNGNLSDIVRQYQTKGYADEKPINVFDHRYIIHPDQTCSGNDTIKVLFVVKSSPDHSMRRAIIRKTWADRKRFPWTRTVFSFGIPEYSKSLVNLQEESAKSNDILLVSYSDTYYNLTLKTIHGMRWAVTNCARAMYVVSLDDDIYVAPDLLLGFLDKLPVRKTIKLFNGHLMTATSPVRDAKGTFQKWYVTTNEYPFQNYPDYIFGGFVIMSMSTVKSFTIAAQFTKILKFEDVYLGILAAKLGIEATFNSYVDSRKTITASESFKTLIASHFYKDPFDLQKAWECHLSIIENDSSKSIFCVTINTRLHELQSEIDKIVDMVESVKKYV